MAACVAHSGKRPSALIAVDGSQLGGISDHAGNLPAMAVSTLVIPGELEGCADEGAHGAKAMSLIDTRITLAPLGRDRFEAAQSALAVGDFGARVSEYAVD
jgi:hypothetical protein